MIHDPQDAHKPILVTPRADFGLSKSDFLDLRAWILESLRISSVMISVAFPGTCDLKNLRFWDCGIERGGGFSTLLASMRDSGILDSSKEGALAPSLRLVYHYIYIYI